VRDIWTFRQSFVDPSQKITGSGPIGISSNRWFLVYFTEGFIQSPENER